MTIIKKYITLLRPAQWAKNLLILFPPFFGGSLLKPSALSSIAPSLLSFSLLASCGYIVNDILDRDSDRHHTDKKARPIVRGDISLLSAWTIAAALYATAMIIAGSLSVRFQGYLIIYFFISLLYTMHFKHQVVMDIFFIAFGFLVRLQAGGEVFGVPVSRWLFLTVFMVALFLATGKRLGEMITIGEGAHKHRASLHHYSPEFLQGILWFSASAALVMYSLYAIDNKMDFFYTVPLAAYGLIRYIFVVKEGKGDPTEALFRDSHILMTGIAWALMIAVILYG